MGDRGLVHPDVVVITDIQELLPSELGAVVVDDGVGDLEAKNNVLDKTSASPRSTRRNLSTTTSRWVKHSGAFLMGPRRSRPHTANGHVTRMVWSSWARAWICLAKYWHPLQDLAI
jgi:hypothetical protein